jgi:predicted DNA binding CopG/RHH family protein
MNEKAKKVADKFDGPFFDEEERELIEDWEQILDSGEFKRDKPLQQARSEWEQIAHNAMKREPVTVRLQEMDIQKIKAKALEKGIPYQTLLSSIIHQYANGTLKETV